MHGIVIDFSVGRESYNATYLPEVCTEQGWTQEECVESLAKKAGFYGKLTEAVLRSIKARVLVSLPFPCRSLSSSLLRSLDFNSVYGRASDSCFCFLIEQLTRYQSSKISLSYDEYRRRKVGA